MFGDWLPYMPRAARVTYDWMDSTDWHFFPESGGFFDQDQALMEDVALLSRMAGLIREQIRVNDEEEGCDHA